MNDPIAQTLSVQPVPPAPLVICDAPFLHTLAVVERDIAHLDVVNPDAAQLASNLLQRLTTAGAKLNEARLAVGAPLRAKLEEINAAARAPSDRIESAKRGIKAKITAYEAERARAAAEAERARLAEIERLEKLRQQEAEEARRKAEELARLAQAPKKPIVSIEWDDDPPPAPPPKTETEMKIEAVKYAPPVEAPRPTGVAFKSTLIIASIDVEKLPDAFVIRTANERGIRATFCVGWKADDPIPVCPGVAFKIDKQVVSTGKATF